MEFRNAVKRTAVIIIIIALSLLAGYVFQVVGHSSDLKKHPMEYEEYVGKYSAEYGVPEYIIYAYMLNTSNFKSNYVSDEGRVGLMQLSESAFLQASYTVTGEYADTGLMYDPDSNVRYGTYMMSFMYTEYNRWKTVIAAMLTDKATVEGWMENPKYTDSNGNLVTIPDSAVAEKVQRIEKDIELYQSLYYN